METNNRQERMKIAKEKAKHIKWKLHQKLVDAESVHNANRTIATANGVKDSNGNGHIGKVKEASP